MATDARSLPAFLADDATFRTWGSGISAQLAAIGLVKTADTGQINWASVVRPAASAYAGYEIWRFNDAAQATVPVYLKIEYGVGSAQDRPALALTVGSNSNGAGTLGGQLSTRQAKPASGSKTAGATLISYASGDGDALRLMNNYDAAASQFYIMLVVERARDGAGAPAGKGVWMCAYQGTSPSHGVLPAAGALPGLSASQAALPVLDPSAAGATSTYGTDIALSPLWALIGRMYPLLGVVNYKSTDIGAGVPFTGEWLGATRTWWPFGLGGPQGTGASALWAFLWE